MNRKVKVLVLALVLVLSFTACKKQVEEPEVQLEEEVPVESIEGQKADSEEMLVEKEIEEEKPRSFLSGLEADQEVLDQAVVGIMLDNHKDARWQAGISEAEIVYEIRVEGGVTRYLALFQINSPHTIGPIRSARTPFVNRIMEYDGVYMHFGGSPQAGDDIANFGVNTINGMAVSQPVFYRNHSVGKVAPHNAYSSMEEIRKYIASRGYSNKMEEPIFEFYKKPTAPQGRDMANFTLPILTGNSTSYEYIADKGIYHRYKDGSLQVDENTQQPLEVTNVILQYANGIVIDGVGRVNLDDVGQGYGYFFSQGKMSEISWSKDSRQAPTYFFDEDGQPLKLNVGQTFIQVMDEGREVIED